ncbi:MAG: periplasmic heavy metal sensor [Hyphomicrobium sp.]|nr:periplasmic heavy metal sensor [Hyphomicrobium sp.]
MEPGPTAPEAATDPAARPRRWTKWLLVVSLALNLLIAGGLAGAWWHHRNEGPMRWAGGPSDFGLMYFSRSLPEERREAVRKLLREGRKSLRDHKSEVTALRASAADALAADDFSPEKFRAAVETVGTSEETRRKGSIDVLMQVVQTLTPDERKRLAAMWKKRIERESRRFKKPKDDDGP